jgi:hypothetical protein
MEARTINLDHQGTDLASAGADHALTSKDHFAEHLWWLGSDSRGIPHHPIIERGVMSGKPCDLNYPVSLMTMLDLHCSLAFVLLSSPSVITTTIFPIDSPSNPILRYSTSSPLLCSFQLTDVRATVS